MQARMMENDIQRLYSLRVPAPEADGNIAEPVLRHLHAAWQALEELEQGLPGGPDRWQADSLYTAREGIRRAGLAVSSLGRGLR
jgi:hypothetical protein